MLDGLVPIARCCRELLAETRRRAPETPGAAGRAARSPYRAGTGNLLRPRADGIRVLARVSDLGAKGIWPSPESQRSHQRQYSRSLRKKIDDVLREARWAIELSPCGRPRPACGSPGWPAGPREHEELKRRRRGLDFDDLLVMTRDLLRDPTRMSTSLAARDAIEFVLVDEFQDTDGVQGEILRLLSGDGVPRRPAVRGRRRQAVDLPVPRRRAGDLPPLAVRVPRAGAGSA